MLCVYVFSLGIVLTSGHGKNFFIGNVSVEEGKDFQIINHLPVSVCKSSQPCGFSVYRPT